MENKGQAGTSGYSNGWNLNQEFHPHITKNVEEWKAQMPKEIFDPKANKPNPKPTTQADIIWDLSTRLGEAQHKLRMLEWKLDEMKKIIND